MSHFDRLIALLKDHHIPFEIKIHSLTGTPQIFYPSAKDPECDIICHYFSYGGEQGLLEIMGLLTDDEKENDDVVGWLTSDNVFERIFSHYWANRIKAERLLFFMEKFSN